MKIGLKLGRTKKGKIIVHGFDPGKPLQEGLARRDFSNLHAPQLKPLARPISMPATTSAFDLPIAQSEASEEEPAIEQVAEPEIAPPSGLTAAQDAARAASAAVMWRRSPIAIAAGAPPVQLAQPASDDRATPEFEEKRIAEIERKEAEAQGSKARAAYIDAPWKNQARSERLFESNYDPLAYRKR
jgi:hypothetical protein